MTVMLEIRYLIAMIVLAAAAIIGFNLGTPDHRDIPATPTPGTTLPDVLAVASYTPVKALHTQEWAQAQCDWNEATQYGLNPNGVLYLNCTPMHGWGSHQAHVIIQEVNGPIGFCRIIDIRGFWHSYDCGRLS